MNEEQPELLFERTRQVIGLRNIGFERASQVLAGPQRSSKWIVRDRAGAPRWFISYSPPSQPNEVESAVRRSENIHLHLDAITSQSILLPIFRGRVDQRSFAIYPYCVQLRVRHLNVLTRMLVLSELFHWLKRMAEQTVTVAVPDEIDTHFRLPLRRLESVTRLHEAREAARDALYALAQNKWSPRHIAMHGDLWIGNILSDRTGGNLPAVPIWGRRKRLVVTDWEGSQLQGYAFYDLLRLCGSLRVSTRVVRREVEARCPTVDCSPRQSLWYLAAALGSIGMTLGDFPIERYHQVIYDTFACLRRALRD